MKIVNFADGQRSLEWGKWRLSGIGASEISILMGSNKFKTPLQLWDEKCGYRSSDFMNAAMAHGIKNEDVALRWINENHQLNLEPLCIEDIEYSHFKASLDGYDLEKKVLCEIKCPVSDDILNKAREYQEIPLYWQHQLQWQIMLCKPIRAFIAIWDYRYNSCVTVEAFAQPTLQKEMIEKAKNFWRSVQIGIPPKPSEKDYVKVEDERLKELLNEYQDHDLVAKAADMRKKALKKEIIEFGDDGNFTAYDFLMTRCAPRLTYDVEKMRMDGIDIDQYARKNNAIGYYRISCPKVFV